MDLEVCSLSGFGYGQMSQLVSRRWINFYGLAHTSIPVNRIYPAIELFHLGYCTYVLTHLSGCSKGSDEVQMEMQRMMSEQKECEC